MSMNLLLIGEVNPNDFKITPAGMVQGWWCVCGKATKCSKQSLGEAEIESQKLSSGEGQTGNSR